ncbi:MAG: glycosyltransferase family 2 protein [Solobacterium sp.]|nr:glycosyltransferase family 2 protein [Solobacterium sp.]
MKTLIVIPAYNEEENIVRVVSHLQEVLPQYDYVVINDGSSDHTRDLCIEHGFHLIDQPINLGLAGTFQCGMKYAEKHGYDAVIQFDGDGQHRPEYIPEMEKKIEEGYDIVIGSRFLTKKKPSSMRMVGSNLIQSLTKMTTGQILSDPTSGMRMYGKRVIQAMAEQINLNPEPDTISFLMRCGAKVAEIQVEMDERIAGESYLTAWKSIQYMASVCVSILFIGAFRKRIDLEG